MDLTTEQDTNDLIPAQRRDQVELKKTEQESSERVEDKRMERRTSYQGGSQLKQSISLKSSDITI